ncbi:hypothetical protein ACFW6S_04290 [Streptomyces sp. NPDC058740]|uniref:hypothetical protein n=1 Tax=Streptomyces sp. NPDC058740 TaxID=3346619 RepID=UPI0036BE10E8
MSVRMPRLAKVPLPDLDRQVLELIAEGFESQEIATRLGLQGIHQVQYRITSIARRFRLKAVVRPQLVDHAYAHGALPAPTPLEPVLLRAQEYGLVRSLATGGTLGAYGQKAYLGPYLARKLMKETCAKLDAATPSSLIRRAWQRQVLGPSVFAADLARMHGQLQPVRDLGRWVIVPLRSGHRLAGPADDFYRTRHLDITGLEEARAAARFLSARDGFAPLWITGPNHNADHRADPFRVSWGVRDTAATPGHGLTTSAPPPHPGGLHR